MELTLVTLTDSTQRLLQMKEWARGTGWFKAMCVIFDGDRCESDDFLRVRAQLFDHAEQVTNELNAMPDTEWILRLDDDERVASFPAWDTSADGLWCARRWVWPDPHHYISDGMWHPDSQLRLFRKGMVEHDGGLHNHPRCLGKESNAPLLIDHYCLVWENFDRRMQRMMRYADLSNMPPTQYSRGLGQFYLPETYPANYTVSPL